MSKHILVASLVTGSVAACWIGKTLGDIDYSLKRIEYRLGHIEGTCISITEELSDINERRAAQKQKSIGK